MTNFDYIKSLTPKQLALCLAQIEDMNEWVWRGKDYLKWLEEETELEKKKNLKKKLKYAMHLLRKVIRSNCDFKDEFINKTYDYFKKNNLKPIDNNKNAIFYKNKMTLKLYRIIKGL